MNKLRFAGFVLLGSVVAAPRDIFQQLIEINTTDPVGELRSNPARPLLI